MDPAAAKLLETVLLDAIKILGPATIAGIVAYKSASAQFQIKIEELKQEHAFQARQTIFAHTNERIKRVDSDLEKLNRELGELLGFLAGSQGDDAKSSTSPLIEYLGQAAESMARAIRLEIRMTLQDLEQAGLQKSDVSDLLSDYRDYQNISGPHNLSSVTANLLTLREIHNLQALAMHRILNVQQQSALKPYVTP